MSKSVFPLLQSIKLGPYTLKNKIVMSSMTRMRGGSDSIANELHAQYYADRSESAGVVFTESSPVSREAEAFIGSCGIYNKDQVEGWKRVTESVHKVNGRIYLQLFHAGRVANNIRLSPSRIPSHKFVHGIWEETELPFEMNDKDMSATLNHFERGAKYALEAGFDGVQLHGANGYLVDQFLCDSTNQRSDKFGGSIENRCRFPLMIMDALCSVFGSEKVGIKLSPVGRYQDMFDSNPEALMKYFLKELSNRKVSFVEMMRGPDYPPVLSRYDIKGEDQIPQIYKTLKPHFSGIMIANNRFNWDSGNDIVKSGEVDMVSFGRLFISNPDLVNRWVHNWKLNDIDFTKTYSGGAEGFVDYPKHK